MAAAISGTPHSLGYVQSSLGVTAGLVEGNLVNKDGVVQKSPAASAQAAILVSNLNFCHLLIYCILDSFLRLKSARNSENDKETNSNFGISRFLGQIQTKNGRNISKTTYLSRFCQTSLTSRVSLCSVAKVKSSKGTLYVPHMLEQ